MADRLEWEIAKTLISDKLRWANRKHWKIKEAPAYRGPIRKRLIPATAPVGFLLADFGSAVENQLCLLSCLPSHGPHKFSGSQSSGGGEKEEEKGGERGDHLMSFDLANEWLSPCVLNKQTKASKLCPLDISVLGLRWVLHNRASDDEWFYRFIRLPQAHSTKQCTTPTSRIVSAEVRTIQIRKSCPFRVVENDGAHKCAYT